MPYSDNMNFGHVEFFGLKARFQRILDALNGYAARRAVYRKTVADLQALSDRDLADFGYHRSEIPQIARKTAAAA